MLRNARKQAGISREEASFRLHIGCRTLSDYEGEKTTAPPDVVLRMSEVYNAPDLPADYCSDVCPIGQMFAHRYMKHDLAVAVLGLLKEMSDVEQLKGNLVSLAADGQIEESEKPEFESIMREVCQLEKQIGELKLFAMKNGISVEEMMPEERRIPA